jgi:hypothetical protein
VWNDDGLHVASRNWELREYTASGAANLYWETAKKYDWTKLPEGVAAQFERGFWRNPLPLGMGSSQIVVDIRWLCGI